MLVMVDLVSVIIPVYNGKDLLDEQLQALAGQDYDGDFEVVVSDNGSTDGVADHLATHQLRDELNLRVVNSSDAQGPSHARNIGAAQAKGELLLFCDQDDRVHPDWMRKLVAFSAGYDLFGSAIEGHSLNGADARRVAGIAAPESFQPAGVFAPVIVGCSFGATADAYRDLGGMDVTWAANHDVELGWRAHNRGYRVGFLPEALVGYRYRTGVRAGLKQGWIRGIEMARLNAEFPDNGLPEIRVTTVAATLARLLFAWRMSGEEWGLLASIALGQVRGGLKYRTLRI